MARKRGAYHGHPMGNGSNRAPGGVEHLVFLGRFLLHPRTVGAIAPSSRYLARRMVAGIERSEELKVVELGPGTGALTGAIAGILPPGGRYLGIERDPVFVRILAQRWPQLECVCDSVESLVSILDERGLLPVDHIVSGLPFASLPSAVTPPILDAIRNCLRPGGTFTTFQYLHAYPLPAARAFRAEMRERFGPPRERGIVVRNLPPCFVLTWRTPG
ncbi:MAG: class I SAM-dependent methyltransferase [Thermoanaerobaculia bacterium]